MSDHSPHSDSLPAVSPRASPRWLGRLRDAGLMLLALIALVANYHAYRDFVFEDAFITYRYAENIALGRGFVFNPGERVLGASAPLYTFLLALLHRLGLALPVAGGLCTAFFLSAAALCGAWLARRQGFPNLGVIYAVVVLWGSGGVLHFWGMETTMVSCLALCAVTAAVSGHWKWSGVLTGLACITRFDGAVLAAALLGMLWLRDRRPPWRTGLVAAAVATPWFVFSVLYFGSLLPNTLGAKAHDVATLDSMWGSIRIAALRFFLPLQRFADVGELPPATFFLGLFFLLSLPILLRLPALWRHEPLLLVLALYPVGLWLGYSLIGPPLEHPWYLIPALHCLVLLALIAWGTLFEHGSWTVGPVALTAACTLASVVLVPIGVHREARVLLEEDGYRHRIGAYATMAAWLRSHDCDDLELFTPEPGYLTFLSKNPVIDGAGLITKGIHFHGPKERRTEWSQLLREHSPELLVVPEVDVAHGRIPKEFTPVYRTAVNSLAMRRDIVEARIDRLSRDWLLVLESQLPAGELGHPLDIDFEEGRRFGWWGCPRFIGHPADLELARRPIDGAYLTTMESITGQPTATVESPPFRIDFDELAFWFFATGGADTAAELLVNGQVLLRLDGTDTPGVPAMVRWPVYPWRGHTAILRFVDHADGKGALAADDIRSFRYHSSSSIDDFESGRFDDTWQLAFDDAPTHFRKIARRLGVSFVRGRYSALSLWLRGERELLSRPFEITHDELAFVVFDFGGRHRTRIELVVDEEAARTWRGGFRQRLEGVIWPVAGLRGRTALLRVLDETAESGVGIGIDDIRLFDVEDRAALREESATPSSLSD